MPACTTTSVEELSFSDPWAPKPGRLASCAGSASPPHRDPPASCSAWNPRVRTKRLR